jgi:hypothetical protein
MAEVEVGVINPDGTATAWGARTAVAATGHLADPVGEQPFSGGQVEVGPGVQQQHHPDLLGDWPGVHRQHRQVRWAGPLDHRPHPRTGPCRQPLHRSPGFVAVAVIGVPALPFSGCCELPWLWDVVGQQLQR